MQQTTFILRCLLRSESAYEIVERFLTSVDYSDKPGTDIKDVVSETMNKNDTPIKECRAQGYDNGVNMAEKYKGAQGRILKRNSLAYFFNSCLTYSEFVGCRFSRMLSRSNEVLWHHRNNVHLIQFKSSSLGFF